MKESNTKSYTKEKLEKLINSLQKEINERKNSIENSLAPKEDNIRKTFEREKIKKIADSLKNEDRLAHIKSKGNGL